MKILSRVAIIFSLLFYIFPVQAANPLDLVINEIAWMGTENSSYDEWIELYNNTSNPIKLEGWLLQAEDGTPKINLSGTVPGKSFYLLERTNDETVPNVPVSQIYTGALSNNGEGLKIYDNLGNLIDAVACSSGWFAGDNSTKQTMARGKLTSPGSYSSGWQTSRNPNGSPKAENSFAAKPPDEELTESNLSGETEATEKPSEKQAEAEDIPFQTKNKLAAVREQAPGETHFLPLLIAFGLAIFSGIIILFLKKKVETS